MLLRSLVSVALGHPLDDKTSLDDLYIFLFRIEPDEEIQLKVLGHFLCLLIDTPLACVYCAGRACADFDLLNKCPLAGL